MEKHYPRPVKGWSVIFQIISVFSETKQKSSLIKLDNTQKGYL